jgi:arylformamidase
MQIMAWSQIIDLSHTLDPFISVYPGSDQPVLKNIARFEQYGYREKELILTSHHGTHVDCPVHLLDKGLNTGNMPLENFYGKGMVLDCRSFDSQANIGTERLHSMQAQIAESDFLLLLTGMDRHWKTPEYLGHYPVLSTEAATFLTDFHLKGIGIDTLSVDPVGDNGLAVHKILLSAHMIIIENLTRLDKLPEKDFLFCSFPLKIMDGDGSPVRACGIV